VTDDIENSGPQRVIRWTESQRAFIQTLLEASKEDVTALIRRKLDMQCFAASFRAKLEWILDEYARNEKMPGIDRLELQFPGFTEETLVLFGDKATYEAQPLADTYRQVREMYQAKLIAAETNQIAALWNDPNTSIADLVKFKLEAAAEIAAFKTDSDDDTKTLRDSVSDILFDVQEAALGKRWGIPFPFPFFQHATMGGQPGDVTTIIGRPGIGKTFAVLMCVISAITGNPYFFTAFERAAVPSRFQLTKETLAELMLRWRTRVMVMSLEMSPAQLRLRLAALLSKVGYPELRSGRFSEGNEAVFKQRMERLAQPGVGDNCLIADRIITPTQIFASAVAFKARLVVVDGFYLMAGEDEKRWETVQRNLALFRAHAKLTGIHYILVSQLDTASDRIMFSQAIEQDSANVLTMHQTRMDKTGNQVRLASRKVRDGTSGEEYLYFWDVAAPRFTQDRIAPARETRG